MTNSLHSLLQIYIIDKWTQNVYFDINLVLMISVDRILLLKGTTATTENG